MFLVARGMSVAQAEIVKVERQGYLELSRLRDAQASGPIFHLHDAAIFKRQNAVSAVKNAIVMGD